MATLKQLISATLDAHLKSKTDSALSSTSTNPVQSKVIKAAIDAKTFPVDSAMSATSTNAVQNKVVTAALNTAGYQVGDLRLYAGSDVPDGWFRCDGSTVSNMETNYPKLYAILGTNVLPNYTGRVPLGASSNINELVSAGLPNVYGEINYSRGLEGSSSGALNITTVGSEAWAVGHADNGGRYATTITLDASVYNSIYGSSETVMPPSVKTAVLIRHD